MKYYGQYRLKDSTVVKVYLDKPTLTVVEKVFYKKTKTENFTRCDSLRDAEQYIRDLLKSNS